MRKRILTMKDLATKAMEHFKRERLTAQSPVPGCKYEMRVDRKVYHCAIGAALTRDEHKKITDQGAGLSLYSDFPVRFADPEDASQFQCAHDTWANRRRVLISFIAMKDHVKRSIMLKARADANDAQAKFLDLCKRHLEGK